jgi:hypothetical protein
LNVDYQFDGLRLRFNSYEAPDVREQSILLAAIGLAGLDSLPLNKDAQGQIGRQLWLDLEPVEQAVFDTAIVVTCSYYQLLQAAGLATEGQKEYERVKDVLYRLASINCRAYKDGYDWSMKLLSYAARPDGQISIAMNSRFARALAGQFVRIDLEERRQLGAKQKGSEVAELLHCYLTAWIRDGHSQRVGLDTLACKVYGNESKNYDTGRTRRDTIAKGLALIGTLPSWSIMVDGVGIRAVVHIKRGKIEDIALPPTFID